MPSPSSGARGTGRPIRVAFLAVTLVATIAACSGVSATRAPGTEPAAATTAAKPSPSASPVPSATMATPAPLPSPDLLAPAEDCPPIEWCRKVAVERISAIPFTPPVQCGDRGSCELVLDLYYPATPPGKDWRHPVVAFIPGGPEPPTPHGTAIALRLAGQGAVVVDASWRQVARFGGGQGRGYADIACAILATRGLAPQVGGNAEKVTLVGHSLGGWGAAVVAATPGGIEPEPGTCLWTEGSPEPDGFVGLAGAYGALHDRTDDVGWLGYIGVAREDDPEAWLAADPIALIERNGPIAIPLLLVHGEQDGSVEIGQSRRLAEALTAAGRPTGVFVLEGVDHGGILEAPATFGHVVDLAFHVAFEGR